MTNSQTQSPITQSPTTQKTDSTILESDFDNSITSNHSQNSANLSTNLANNSTSFKLLTDILGWEDHHCDMDFKVTGTRDGITAIQLDNKVAGLTSEILKEALFASKKARIHILDIMSKTISKPNTKISQYAPSVIRIQVPIDKIRDVIGSGGSIINGMEMEFGVEIDLNNDTGETFIYGKDENQVFMARDKILTLIKEWQVGEIVEGTIFRIESFGAFVDFEGKEGMIHISNLSKKRLDKVEDAVHMGQKVQCSINQINDKGQINLSLIKVLE